MGAVLGKPYRVLVLCVDRDNDIGMKAGIRTPVVGKEDCMNAGSKLALSDPEEADANAIFAAVKETEELTKKGYETEVAVIAGQQEKGLEADQKILAEAESLMNKFHGKGVILVVDGAEDESILPVLQGTLPIQSVKRVIIKHSRSVEESYAVMGRYLRTILYEPRYSRFALGVPGFLILTIGLLAYFDLTRVALTVSLVIMGAALVIRGFDIDRIIGAYVISFRRPKPSEYIRLFSILSSLLVSTAGIYIGYVTMSGSIDFQKVMMNPDMTFEFLPRLIGSFIQESITVLWVGIGTYFAGTLLSHWMAESRKVVREAIGITVLVLLYMPVLQFSLILRGVGNPTILISLLLIGLAGVFVAVAVSIQYRRSRRQI